VFEKAYCNQAVCGPSRNSFMTGRRPFHTMVFDGNTASFRDVGWSKADGPGKDWITMPQHFKDDGFVTLGGGKTFHPKSPKNWDEPKSWSKDLPYFDFAYWINPNTTYKGPCPGPGKPQEPLPDGGSCTGQDTWCNLEEPDHHFYDDTLATNTIQRLRHAAPVYTKTGQPFFIMSGFARPHAPWRVPQRFWDLYKTENVPLAEHKLPPEGMPGVAWHQQGCF
jgi:iduronate 2-sulfatase